MNSIPAFPSQKRKYLAGYATDKFEPVDGMALRDYFAAKVVQGLLANSSGPVQDNSRSGWGFVNCEIQDIANLSYELADSMIKARMK